MLTKQLLYTIVLSYTFFLLRHMSKMNIFQLLNFILPKFGGAVLSLSCDLGESGSSSVSCRSPTCLAISWRFLKQNDWRIGLVFNIQHVILIGLYWLILALFKASPVFFGLRIAQAQAIHENPNKTPGIRTGVWKKLLRLSAVEAQSPFS